MGCSPWGHKESDMPEYAHTSMHTHTHKGRQRAEGFLLGDRKPPECLLGRGPGVAHVMSVFGFL